MLWSGGIRQTRDIEGLDQQLSTWGRRAPQPHIPGAPVATFEAWETWSDGSAQTADPYVGIGLQARKITGTDAGVQSDCTNAVTGVDVATYPVSEVVLYVADASKVSSILVYVAGSAGFSGPYAQKTLSVRTGWNVYRCAWAVFQAQAGWVTGDWATASRLRVKVTATSGQTVDVYFAQWRACRPRAVVLLDHDDVADDAVDMAAMEKAFGFRSTFYVTLSFIGTAGFATWPQLEALYADGWDVASHHADHTDPSGQSVATLTTTMTRTRAALTARGFVRSARMNATPFGRNTADIRTALANAGMVTNRASTSGGARGSTSPLDGWTAGTALRFNNLSENDTPASATVIGWINDAIAARETLVLLLHTMKPSASAGNRWASSKYEQVLGHIAGQVRAGTVEVLPVSEFHNRWSPVMQMGESDYRLTGVEGGALTIARAV